MVATEDVWLRCILMGVPRGQRRCQALKSLAINSEVQTVLIFHLCCQAPAGRCGCARVLIVGRRLRRLPASSRS